MSRSGRSAAEIEHLVRARYPLIYVVSWEEGRVEDALQEIAQRRSKRLILWSVTEGMVGMKGSAPAELRDPLKALEWIMESKDDAIVAMRDFHPFLGDPTIVRRLRDLARQLKKTYKNIVIVSPLLKIPPELEKEINVVHFEMPDAEDLEVRAGDELAHRRFGAVAAFDGEPLAAASTQRPGDEPVGLLQLTTEHL